MMWYTELGFEYNPLETNPLKINSDIYGYDEEIKLLAYYIESGNAVIIEGKPGSGKTALLSAIINRFGGKGKVVYVDAKKLSKRLNVSNILIKNQNIFRRMFNKKPKDMIVLLDNATNITPHNYKLLQYYFDQNHVRSVVFTVDNIENLNLPESFYDRIGKRVIKTKEIAKDDAVKVVLDRLTNKYLSKENVELIYDLYKSSDDAFNMNTFIKRCEAVLDYMAKNKKLTISDDEIKEIFDRNNFKTQSSYETYESTHCHECGNELVKVGDNYRCETCDSFCLNCGALIEDEDVTCPDCGVVFEDYTKLDDNSDDNINETNTEPLNVREIDESIENPKFNAEDEKVTA